MYNMFVVGLDDFDVDNDLDCDDEDSVKVTALKFENLTPASSLEITLQELAEKQSKDLKLRRIKAVLTDKLTDELPEVNSKEWHKLNAEAQAYFLTDENVLMKIVKSDKHFKDLDPTFEVYVAPEEMIEDLINRAHVAVSHAGVSITYAFLRRKWYFDSLYKAVRHFCLTCHKCQVYKLYRSGGKVPLCPIPLSTAELSFEIDVLTSPKTEAKNELLLVAVEVGTGWIEAWKIPDSTSTTICNTLIEHLISRFEIPASIKCDRGF